jgi:hypothetical protein
MAGQPRVIHQVVGMAADYWRSTNGDGMEYEPTWVERLRAGTASIDDVDTWVAEWRANPVGTLEGHLGLTGPELLVLLHHRGYFPRLAEALKAGRPTRQILDEIADWSRNAR